MSAAPPKKSSLKLDAALTFVAQATVAICTFFQYRAVRNGWADVADFAAYSNVFRYRNVVEWIVLLVMPTALARQIAAFRAVDDPKSVSLYMWTGLTAGTCFTLVFGGLMSLFPRQGATILFGNAAMEKWVVPFNVLLFGYAFALMVNALMRGFQQFRLSNILLLTYVGFVPLICASLRGYPLTQVVIWNGIASFTAALLALAALVVREKKLATPKWNGWKEHSDALQWMAVYGAPRIVTQMCTAGLTLSIPWFVLHEGDERLLGGVNSIFLVLGASSILVAGMSFVLLPHLSAMLAKGEKEAAGRQLSVIIEFTLFAGGAAVLLALGIEEPFLHMWVGPKISGFPILIAAGSLVIPAVLLLEILRGPMDAVSKVPWNAVAYGIGAGFAISSLAILHRAGLHSEGLVAGVLLASYAVSAATALFLANKLFILKVPVTRIAINFAICLVLIFALIAVKPHLGVGLMILLAICASALFVGISILAKPSWLSAIAPSVARKLQRGSV